MASQLVKIFATGVIFSVAFGCSPVPKIDQEEFCSATYVFKARVKSADPFVEYFTETTITIDILEDYKKTNKAKGFFDTVISPTSSCGPMILEAGETYLIYASVRDDGKLEINEYNSGNVTFSDIERMTTKYDCDCKIDFNLNRNMSKKSVKLPSPTQDECNAPEVYCRRSALCWRNEAGVCTWGNLGECY